MSLTDEEKSKITLYLIKLNQINEEFGLFLTSTNEGTLTVEKLTRPTQYYIPQFYIYNGKEQLDVVNRSISNL